LKSTSGQAYPALHYRSQAQGLVLFRPTKVPPFFRHNARIKVANLSPVLPRWLVFSMTTGNPTAWIRTRREPSFAGRLILSTSLMTGWIAVPLNSSPNT
jgi:hypothetical protein